MVTRYKLIAPYPNHQIGDIAVYDPRINDEYFIWENSIKDSQFRLIRGEDYKIIPQDFQPDMTPDWFEKVEDEKTLEDYKYLANKSIAGINLDIMERLEFHAKNIYWTEVLRCIAKDLNKDKMLDEYKYHILRTNDRVWTSTVSEPHSWPGLISFIRKEDCQKAIDLLNNNLKYLFNEE